MQLALEIKNNPGEIEKLAARVEEFCQSANIPFKSIFEINLSLDELITNTISYGYPGGGEHWIQVQLSYGQGCLEIRLTDDGTAFNPLEAPPPPLDQPLEDRPIGGLGVHLVRTYMDEIDYQREQGKNKLLLRKKISGGKEQ